MSSPSDPGQSQDVASRVLKRARVSQMTRALQDRLALANIKMKHGWQNRSIHSLEPEIQQLKRKRSHSNGENSDSSSVSGHCFSAAGPSSSPLTAPIFSDEAVRSGSSHGSIKRFKMDGGFKRPASSSHTRDKVRAVQPTTLSWKSDYQLPESSPISYSKRQRSNVADTQIVSFVSASSTILNSPSESEDDDQDLPVKSFQHSTNNIPSSPPRTPPPEIARSAHLRSKSFSSSAADAHPGKEGADLLLYLAASPSPAMRADRAEMVPPSTPPSKNTPLPSSMMSTPGGQTLLGWGPNTPSGGAFNLSEFVNVTPSPAQGPWSRTPAAAKTPLAAREARRRLNFDGLAPPSTGSGTSPNIYRSSTSKGEGLGMELGGELVS